MTFTLGLSQARGAATKVKGVERMLPGEQNCSLGSIDLLPRLVLKLIYLLLLLLFDFFDTLVEWSLHEADLVRGEVFLVVALALAFHHWKHVIIEY